MHWTELIADHTLDVFNNGLDNTKEKNGRPEDTAMEIALNGAQREKKGMLNDEKASVSCRTVQKSLTHVLCDFQKRKRKNICKYEYWKYSKFDFLKNYKLIHLIHPANYMRNKHKDNNMKAYYNKIIKK